MHSPDTNSGSKLDRTTAPSFGKVDKLNLIHAKSVTLDNGMNVHYVNAGAQDLIKLEIILKAGKYYQSAPLVSAATCSMIDNGTPNLSASQIADRIDFFGAFFASKNSFDFSEIALHCQSIHLKEVLPLIHEVISTASFPQSELDLFKHNGKARLIQEAERVEVMASHRFNEVIFGTEHPYGSSNLPEYYDVLDRKNIQDFHAAYYVPENMEIILSGKVNDQVIRDVNAVFGKKSSNKPSKASTPNHRLPQNDSTKKHFIKKEKAVQSAIRIGKPLFNKSHSDYQGLLVLNTIFGGYFGSRLMSNIREDKGFTYGIHSSLQSFVHGGCIGIATEVGAEVTNQAVAEVFVELKKLRENLVPIEELDLVRNYMLGSFMRSIDGPFGLSDRFKGIHTFGLGYDYYDRFFDTIRTITPAQIRELAQQYFAEDSFYTVVAGNQ